MEQQKNLINFLAIWIINTVTLLILSSIFSKNLVLGNDKIAKPMAGVLNGLLITGILYIVPLILKKVDFKIKNEKGVMAVYFVALIIGIWIIKRFAIISGFGISNILFVVICAAVIAALYWKSKIVLPSLYKKFLKS